MKTKVCNKCGVEKLLEEFWIHRNSCKDCQRGVKKEWYRKNKEHSAKVSKIWAQTPRGRFSSYKSGAERRDLEFHLTFEEFMEMWDGICTYCQEEIHGIGVDRVDSSKGYTKENCIPCCAFCNSMKWDKTAEDFLEQVRKIYEAHLQPEA